MTAMVVVALVIVAVIVAAGLVVLVFVTRDAYRTRGRWAEEDGAAGVDPDATRSTGAFGLDRPAF
jgi:preprotein translocase subunit SecG